jgi:hypothetical protein
MSTPPINTTSRRPSVSSTESQPQTAGTNRAQPAPGSSATPLAAGHAVLRRSSSAAETASITRRRSLSPGTSRELDNRGLPTQALSDARKASGGDEASVHSGHSSGTPALAGHEEDQVVHLPQEHEAEAITAAETASVSSLAIEEASEGGGGGAHSISSASLEPPPPAEVETVIREVFEVTEALEAPSHAPQRQWLYALGDTVLDGIRFVTENRAASRLGQATASAVNIGVRNAASVLPETAVRQVMTAGFKSGMDHSLSPGAQAALAYTAIGIPIVLNLIGAFVDHHHKTGTSRSWVGRGLNLALGISAMALAARTGISAEKAAQYMSTFLYCLVRDAVQTCLRLPDESDGQHAGAVVATGLAYVPNQLAVNRGMTVYGSPSGQSAAGIIGQRLNKDFVRAGINTAGETVDDIVDLALHAMVQKKPFRVRLEAGLPNQQQVIDKVLRMGSARPNVFLSSIMLSTVVDKCLVALPEEQRAGVVSNITAAVPGSDQCLVPLKYLPKDNVGMVSDVVFAVLIGLGRIPQVLQTGQRERPPAAGDGAA